MTHRFDVQTRGDAITVVFQGQLDGDALAELDALCRNRCRGAQPVRVLLVAGTTLDPSILPDLLHLEGAEIQAESAFLARWLERYRDEEPPRRKEQP